MMMMDTVVLVLVVLIVFVLGWLLLLVRNFAERRAMELAQEHVDAWWAEIQQRMQMIYAMDAQKLLEAFAGAQELPSYHGTLHVLKALEEIAYENATMSKLSADERAGYLGSMRACREAQERLMDLVKKASDAKKGTEESGRTLRGGRKNRTQEV